MKKLFTICAIIIFIFPSLVSGQGFKRIYTKLGSAEINDVCFVNDTLGFLAGSDNNSSTGAYLERTIDGGNSWQKITSVSDSGSYLKDIQFVSQDTGFVCGSEGQFFITTDGGNNWTRKQLTNLVPSYLELEAISFLDGQKGFVLGSKDIFSTVTNYLYVTDDGGNSFSELRLGSTVNPENDLHFVNDSTGFISSIGGTKRVNYNDPFLTVTSGTGGISFELDFLNDSVGYSTSTDKVLKTRNGGQNFWNILDVGASGGLYSINFFDENAGWTSGTDDRKIFITYDGGQTWKEALLPGNDETEKIFVSEMISPTYGHVIADFKDNSKGVSLYRFGSPPARGNLNLIKGSVFISDDTSCTNLTSATPMAYRFVRTIPGEYYASTNEIGEYAVLAEQGAIVLEQVLPKIAGRLVVQTCPQGGAAHIVQFDSLYQDTAGFNFVNDTILCPVLEVDISSNRRRRCFKSNTRIRYGNSGFAPASNAKVFVEFPEYVSFISADFPYSIAPDGSYQFDIGNILPGEFGFINIVDSVQCINGIMGLTQCTKVRISPINTCLDSLDPISRSGDESFIKLHPAECIGDSVIHFLIENLGEPGAGDMAAPSQYRIYADNKLVYTGTFQLNGGQSITIKIKANGQTIRFEADQRAGLGGKFRPVVFIEGCGNGGQPLSPGEANKAPQNDENFVEEIDCLPIIDSFDPNDKQVSPLGITAERYVMPGTTLDYKIRFQNTGTDTAFRVIIVDTLPGNLDISSLQIGAASHDFSFELSGAKNPIMTFTFDDIDLPDSTRDEANSHGFVKFKIAPKPSLTNGTRIENSADIYFDFNLPVRTNNSWITIHDTVLQGPAIQVVELPTGLSDHAELFIDLSVKPNPFSNEMQVSWATEEQSSSSTIRLFNSMGQLVLMKEVRGVNELSITTGHLEAGFYLLELETSTNKRGWLKLVKQ